MKNTIIETIQGLLIAKKAREDKLEQLAQKDNSAFIAEYKAKLEEELNAKLNEFLANLESEENKILDKITNDIATISELLTEFEFKLADIEANEAELPAESMESENGINETENDCGEATEIPTIVTMPTIETPIN